MQLFAAHTKRSRFQKVYLLKAEFQHTGALYIEPSSHKNRLFQEIFTCFYSRQKVYILTCFLDITPEGYTVSVRYSGDEGDVYLFKLCICDDEPISTKCVTVLAEQFSRDHPELGVRVNVFNSPYDLLEALEVHGGFDLYLLDIVMPNMTGIELARKIRARDEATEIVFLTSSREYALDAFSVKAAGYLLKPVEKADFDSAVLAAAKALLPGSNPSLLLKTRAGLRKIPLRELVLVESQNHTRVCTLADGSSLETSDTLSSMLSRLDSDKRFFSPHRTYIVNLEYVAAFTAAELTMTGGLRVPVSRKLASALRDAYMNYAF